MKDFADEKIYLGDFDLRDYGEDLEYARSSLDGRKSNRYYLCFYTVLDYVVPYVAQSSVTLISDFEDSIVTTHKELRKNDLFMDMCRKSTDFRSHTPFPLDDPLEAAVKEFSLSKRNEIPNLLSREYALN